MLTRKENMADCHKFKSEYIHHFKAGSDTGFEMNLLQEFYFFTLDIFGETLHNEGVTGRSSIRAKFLPCLFWGQGGIILIYKVLGSLVDNGKTNKGSSCIFKEKNKGLE